MFIHVGPGEPGIGVTLALLPGETVWWAPVVGSCAAVRPVTATGAGAEHGALLSMWGGRSTVREGLSPHSPADRDLEQGTHPPCVFPSSRTCAPVVDAVHAGLLLTLPTRSPGAEHTPASCSGFFFAQLGQRWAKEVFQKVGRHREDPKRHPQAEGCQGRLPTPDARGAWCDSPLSLWRSPPRPADAPLQTSSRRSREAVCCFQPPSSWGLLG